MSSNGTWRKSFRTNPDSGIRSGIRSVSSLFRHHYPKRAAMPGSAAKSAATPDREGVEEKQRSCWGTCLPSPFRPAYSKYRLPSGWSYAMQAKPPRPTSALFPVFTFQVLTANFFSITQIHLQLIPKWAEDITPTGTRSPLTRRNRLRRDRHPGGHRRRQRLPTSWTPRSKT